MRTAPGFTLIELFLVMAIALVVVAILPRFAYIEPSKTWPAVIDRVNDVTYLARQEAIRTGIPHRLLFRRIEQQDEVVVEKEMLDPENPSKKNYIPLAETLPSNYLIPKGFAIEMVQLEGEDAWLANRKGTPLQVMADGLVQSSRLTLTRRREGVLATTTLVMEPFLGRWVREKLREELA